MELIKYLHFFMILQPLLYALQLYAYRGIFSKSHRILAIYMILISIYFACNAKFLFPENLHSYLYVWDFPLLLSFNPFYYLYVRSLTHERGIQGTRWPLHFVPSFLVGLITVVGLLWNVQALLFYYVQHVYIFLILYYLQVIGYVSAIVLLLRTHQRNIGNYFSYTENISLSWL